jgi:hypothetical protein
MNALDKPMLYFFVTKAIVEELDETFCGCYKIWELYLTDTQENQIHLFLR